MEHFWGVYFGTDKSWRMGQRLFNTLNLTNQDLANEIRGTRLDPFYNNSAEENLDFVGWLTEKLGE